MRIGRDQAGIAAGVTRALLAAVCLWACCALDSRGIAADAAIAAPEIVTLLPKDVIPAIDVPTPLFVRAQDAKGVRDGDRVLGVMIGGESRAYPIPFLSWHEIVNDTIGGLPIVVTWSPLCYTGIVYARAIHGQALTFGVSGKLWANGLLMYDRQTDSLWSQVSGQAITGSMQGRTLPMVPALQTTWGTWKRLHPATLVLDPSRSPYQRDYNVDPYEGYYASQDTGVMAPKRQDARLPAKALVLGLRLGGAVKAYPFTRLRQAPVVNDTVADTAVVVVFRAQDATGLAFNRRLGEQTLTFVATAQAAGDQPTMRDEQTGSIWSATGGTALQGPWQGKQLEQLPSTYAFWFAWKDYYPQTVVYQEAGAVVGPAPGTP
jgi:hypothetical protein